MGFQSRKVHICICFSYKANANFQNRPFFVAEGQALKVNVGLIEEAGRKAKCFVTWSRLQSPVLRPRRLR